MKTLILTALAATGLLLLRSQSSAEADSWPRSYSVDGAEVSLYEPRLEQWQGSALDARFAIGVKLKGGAEPIYGSFAAHADALANSETRTVTLYNFSASDVQFPDAPDKIAELTRIIDALAPDKPLKVPMDDLLAGVPPDDIVTKTTVTTATKNKAPKVIVRFDNTVLVAFDGKPVFRGIPGTGLEAAVNTPATLLRPEKGGPLYLLTNEGLWLQASGWNGPWSAATSLPPGIDRIPPDHPVAQAVKNVWPPTGAVVSVPEVVTSDTPAELLQFDGKPKYDRIGELPMVRVSNTSSPLFYHFDQGLFYVLISGRWFAASELMGPWTYVAHNELPPDFSQIPEDNPSAEVRASVAGTREAQEAVKEAQIPTYARISKRESPQVQVDYDGDPIFEDVAGNNMAYAINTTSAVVRIGGLYYCCQDGVWFVANSPYGEWSCATSLPQDIYTMPPSCPVYHTRFCDVDSYDDNYVVYRCTPGYWGTYVDPYSDVCVYGTGWWYPPYISSSYYCGHSWTYGLGCHYLRGCGFVRECDGVAHTGWFRHTGRGSAWCRADSDRWGGRFEHNHWHGSSGRSAAFASWNGRVTTRSDDVAQSFLQRSSRGGLSSNRGESRPKAVFRNGTSAGAIAAASFDKDVRAGRHGEVYRHGAEGWQRRDSGHWKNPDSSHPVDPQVASAFRSSHDTNRSHDTNKDWPHIASTNPQGFTRPNHQTFAPQGSMFDQSDKARVQRESSHREPEIRSAQVPDGRHQHMPKVTDAPPAYQARPGDKTDPSRRRWDDLPPVFANRDPNPSASSPPQINRDGIRRADQSKPSVQLPSLVQPQVRRDESGHSAPSTPEEHRGLPRHLDQPGSQAQVPPQIQIPHENVPQIERSQPQFHRESPRNLEQPRIQSQPQSRPQFQHEEPRSLDLPQPQPQAQPHPQPQIHREVPRHVDSPRSHPVPQMRREAPARSIAPPRPQAQSYPLSQPRIQSRPQSQPQVHHEAPRHAPPSKPQVPTRSAAPAHRPAPAPAASARGGGGPAHGGGNSSTDDKKKKH